MPGARGHLNEKPYSEKILGKLRLSPRVKRQLRNARRKRRKKGY